MSHAHWNVAPRYSAGSPAMVDEDTADAVALDEIDMHRAASQGLWGEAERLRALRLGLAGIVELREEHRGWHVYDRITQERFVRPFVVPVIEFPLSPVKGSFVFDR
jgi:hypothetical protein